ncbi:unnamed protein product, partial [Symbiodinium sp. CCMP2456]
MGSLLGSLQDDSLSVSEAIRALEADLRSQAPKTGASTNLKADRGRPATGCRRCDVLSRQLEAVAQSLVGLAGAAFRWSLEVAAGVSPEDRESLWKAMMTYMQPCAHVDQRIALTTEELLKAVAKARSPDELLRSLAPSKQQEQLEEEERLRTLRAAEDTQPTQAQQRDSKVSRSSKTSRSSKSSKTSKSSQRRSSGESKSSRPSTSSKGTKSSSASPGSS